jgi:hypothetical protein
VPRGRTFPRKNSAQVKDKEKDWNAFTCVYLCIYICMMYMKYVDAVWICILPEEPIAVLWSSCWWWEVC